MEKNAVEIFVVVENAATGKIVVMLLVAKDH
jgi:hypothetical protein